LAENAKPVWRYTERATLRMRNFSDAFLDAYLKNEGKVVLGSVGCYQLEGRGAQLFDAISGDFFCVLGLPLLPLLAALRSRGLIAS
jgi:septum formation protein